MNLNINNNNDNNNGIQRRNSRFLYILLNAPCIVSNAYATCTLKWPGHNIVCKSHIVHQALVTCNMSCYVPRGMKEQLSY